MMANGILRYCTSPGRTDGDENNNKMREHSNSFTLQHLTIDVITATSSYYSFKTMLSHGPAERSSQVHSARTFVLKSYYDRGEVAEEFGLVFFSKRRRRPCVAPEVLSLVSHQNYFLGKQVQFVLCVAMQLFIL